MAGVACWGSRVRRTATGETPVQQGAEDGKAVTSHRTPKWAIVPKRVRDCNGWVRWGVREVRPTESDYETERQTGVVSSEAIWLGLGIAVRVAGLGGATDGAEDGKAVTPNTTREQASHRSPKWAGRRSGLRFIEAQLQRRTAKELRQQSGEVASRRLGSPIKGEWMRHGMTLTLSRLRRASPLL